MSQTDAAYQGTQTILFTDLEGSTDLRVRLGDAVANEVFNEHDRLIRSQIEASGGTDIKGLGDGFMALFTSANKAIETAVSIQGAIEKDGDEVRYLGDREPDQGSQDPPHVGYPEGPGKMSNRRDHLAPLHHGDGRRDSSSAPEEVTPREWPSGSGRPPGRPALIVG